MEDPRWVRIIAVGLVLAALAIGYFLLSGSFVKSKPKSQVSNSVMVETPTPEADATSVVVTPKPATTSAYTRILNRAQAQGGIATLPRTGFPVALIGIFSASAMISGWGLRKFPN